MFKRLTIVFLLGLLFSTSIAQAQEETDLADTLVSQGDFTQLVMLLEGANLTEQLRGANEITLFAPTDAAFAQLPPEVMPMLLANPQMMNDLLLYMMVPGRLTIPDIQATTSTDTMLGQPLEISVDGDTITINQQAQIIVQDISASNGLIQAVDIVFLPPELLAMIETTSTNMETSDTEQVVVAELPQSGGYTDYLFMIVLLALGVLFLGSGTAIRLM